MKYIKVKDHNSLLRDPNTGSIVNSNMTEYEQYIARRDVKEQEYKQIHKLQDEVDIIKDDLNEIKTLLRSLLNGSK